MGSSLGPILANIFMSHFETEALSKYSGNFAPLPIEGILMTLFLYSTIEQMLIYSSYSYMNKYHPNIELTMESELTILYLIWTY